jgi:hypothetical protein
MSLNKDHYINLKNGSFDSTSKLDLDHLFTSFSNNPRKPPLVVHFHGGLVSEQTGMQVANKLLPVYESAGGYPVFFVWESGLLEVLSYNLTEISHEMIYQLLLKHVLGFTIGKLRQKPGVRGGLLELPNESEIKRELDKLVIAQTPFSALDQIVLPAGEKLQDVEEQQFLNQNEKDTAIAREIDKIANSFRSTREIDADYESTRGVRVRGSTQTLMSPSILNEIRSEEQATGKSRSLVATAIIIKHALSILRRSITRFAKQRSHGVYVTVVEELLKELYLSNVGGVIWRMMKQDTADAFKDDQQLYGGTAFLEGIKAHWQQGGRPRIVLIGHSTGAVYICHFLRHAQKRLPPDIKFDVVFLAPACTFNLLSSTLQTSAGRVNGIRIFGMKDGLEQADPLVHIIYPRSLLYFVSGVVEDEVDMPLVGMHRFHSGVWPFDAASYPDIDMVRSFIQKPECKVWSKESSGPGRKSQSTRHVDFDEESDTLNSLQYIIKQGL